MLGGLDGWVGGAEPELLIGIQAEVLGNLKHLAALERDGQAFLMPAPDGLVPPHRPFPARQAIHRLEVHHRPKALDVVHCDGGGWPANRGWQAVTGSWLSRGVD